MFSNRTIAIANNINKNQTNRVGNLKKSDWKKKQSLEKSNQKNKKKKTNGQ